MKVKREGSYRMERLNGRSEEPLLLRVKTAANLMDLSQSQVYDMIASGDLPCVHIGRRSVRIPYAALRAWVEGKTMRARAEQERAADDEAK